MVENYQSILSTRVSLCHLQSAAPLASQALNNSRLELQQLEKDVAELEGERRRLAAQINWTRARRAMRTRAVDGASEEVYQQRRHRLHMDVLRSLPSDATTNPTTLVEALHARRDQLHDAMSAENRFVSRADHALLCARHATLQHDETRLSRRVHLEQCYSSRLRVVRMALMAGSDDLAAGDLRARASLTLEAVARFERLFDGGRFEEAAQVAACSPEGVLRTEATWRRFAAVRSEQERWSRRRERPQSMPSAVKQNAIGPLLAYCDALVTAAPAAGESLTCVQYAVEHQQWDRVTRWLAAVRLDRPLSHAGTAGMHGAAGRSAGGALPVPRAVPVPVPPRPAGVHRIPAGQCAARGDAVSGAARAVSGGA